MSVQIACEIDGLPDEATLERWPALVVNHLAAHFEYQQELTVRLVGEAEGRALNQQFRGRDKATNVLSFPAGVTFELPGDEARPLGDLVLCAPVVLQEAAAQGKEPASHWAHLLVHGTLHLMGYDHEDAADAERMEALEVAILAAQGLANPYIERESDR